ncbi:3-methyl-2-oxobutanoate hydroxymethyltransferase [Streptomyces sp. CBMA29]|uniref:3-methyl-2-oxobutanoate hydroxymethyltransferase n=1 Tax=Streptomyces sp. CBMA29 TaxID=1896314 RepID=UPI001CB73A38|nr:3-methyl-2-oxobutanoate hydroxymethyltransferase [Streptomyces sp. CBMA29]MBD0735627.1 3-methyl-2-oxobutanoate hydroxymethyltransferase [Streptomyces sp. CBMA29]
MTTPVMYPGYPGHPSESARAASRQESRFRITVPLAPARNARVIALDRAAEAVARRVARGPWAKARFYTAGASSEAAPGGAPLLFELHGRPAALADVLTGTDVVVILATEDSGRAQAAAIGRECGARAITTAGVVLGDGFEADDAVAALRPHARVLLLSADESDVFELLTALRV